MVCDTGRGGAVSALVGDGVRGWGSGIIRLVGKSGVGAVVKGDV